MELICERCKKIYSPKKNLFNHKNIVHAGKKYKKFTCDPCQEKYPENRSCDDHKITFICNQCNKKMETKIDLTNHKTSCNKHSVMYDCDICNFTCKSIGNLKMHARGKHNGPFYSCDMCPHTTTLKKYLLKHLRKEHETLSALTKKALTTFENEFQNIKDKKEPITGDYKPEPLMIENVSFQCDNNILEQNDIFFTAPTEYNLPNVLSEALPKTLHKPSVKLDEKPEVSVIKYKVFSEGPDKKYALYQENVPIWQEVLEKNNSKKQVFESALETKKKCSSTPELFKGLDLPKKVFSCTKCTKICTTKKRLASHMQSCNTVATYCFPCGILYSCRKYLMDHLKKKHIVFKCEACSMSFTNKEKLNKHIKRCPGLKKPVLCGFKGCTFPFQGQRQMKIHKLDAHKGLACDECGNLYSNIRAWRQHKKRYHNGMFFCGNQTELEDSERGCGKAFRTMEQMKLHMKVCGKPRKRHYILKPWDQLASSQKGRRAKQEREKIRREEDKSEN